MGVKRVTEEEIQEINKLYYELRSYAAVAKITGRSAGTVKKYVIEDWKPDSEKDNNYIFNHFDLAVYESLKWKKGDNLGIYCVLTDDEKRKLRDL